ncbi:MAG: hypothetical protein LH615_04180 [Ferruginibacter sp.]|nr:hypothetical protein [Ferruginibacter sp.]
MVYVNQKDCHLMIWEADSRKRNLNNVITFSISEKHIVTVGDQISCSQGGQRNPVYEIVEVLESRKASISGMNYVTAKTKWFLA